MTDKQFSTLFPVHLPTKTGICTYQTGHYLTSGEIPPMPTYQRIESSH